jgi:hypothetical protein
MALLQEEVHLRKESNSSPDVKGVAMTRKKFPYRVNYVEVNKTESANQ